MVPRQLPTQLGPFVAWMTIIITQFTLIVTWWLRRLFKGLETLDTICVKSVTMIIIHTTDDPSNQHLLQGL